MKAVGNVLVGLGILCLAVAGINAAKAPNISYLIGTFLPGLVILIMGLKLGQSKRPKSGPPQSE
jgi:hypothetical protein